MALLDALSGFLSGAARGGQQGFDMVQDVKRQNLDEREAASRQKYYDSQIANSAKQLELDAARDERDKAWQKFQMAQAQGASAQRIAELEMKLQQAELQYQEQQTRHAGQMMDIKKQLGEMGNQGGMSALPDDVRMMVMAAYTSGDWDKVRQYKELFPEELKGINIPMPATTPVEGTGAAGGAPGMPGGASWGGNVSKNLGMIMNKLFGRGQSPDKLTNYRSNAFSELINPSKVNIPEVLKTPRILESPLTTAPKSMYDAMMMSGEYESPELQQYRKRLGVPGYRR